MIDHIPGCNSAAPACTGTPRACDCAGPWSPVVGFSPVRPATKPPSDVLRSQRATRNVETLPR